MKAITTSSKEIWKSSDGQRTIWEVAIDADGSQYRLKTFSEKIGTVGFEGEVETYMNPRGERFIRQPKQEGGYGGGKGKGANNQPVIQAQWAIGQARGFIRDRGEILPDEEYWLEVEKTAKKLIETVNRILGGSESTSLKAEPKTNPALLKPGSPVWPSDVEDFAASMERGLRAEGIGAEDFA